MARGRKNTPADDLKAAERRKKALALRLTGATLQEIADHNGTAVSTVHSDIDRALGDIPRQEADALRAQEVERLDRLQRAIWGKALQGDLPTIDRVLRIIDRRAKMLGLDAPQQVEVSTMDVDLDTTVAKILQVAELTIMQQHNHLHLHQAEATPQPQEAHDELDPR